MKLEDISKDNESLLDELTFFLFNEKNKLILDIDPNKIVKEKTYLLNYFQHNFELLKPEIYSFILNSVSLIYKTKNKNIC